MTAKRSAIVVLGDINSDLILNVPAYPPEGGEAIAAAQAEYPGGSGANTARMLAYLGMPVRLIGRTGTDATGRSLVARFAKEGIDTRFVGLDPNLPTQINVTIVSASGERTMFAYRGANMGLCPEHVMREAFSDAALLHLSGYAFLAAPQRDAAFFAFDLARTAGMRITLDIPSGVVRDIRPYLDMIIPHCAIIFLNQTDLALLGDGDGVQGLLNRGTECVAVKLGAEGAILTDATGQVHIPGFPVEVCDSTGAGDAFAAGHIAGLVEGLPRRAAGQLANALGAAVCRHFGSGPHEDSDRFLDTLIAQSTDGALTAYLRQSRRDGMCLD